MTRELTILLQRVDSSLGHLLLDGDFAQNAEAWDQIYGMHLKSKKVKSSQIV